MASAVGNKPECNNDDLPEVAHGATYPEVYQHLHYQRIHNQPAEPWPPHPSATANSIDPSNHSPVKTEDYQSYPQVVPRLPPPAPAQRGSQRMMACLSAVIAVLAVLVIALAAGTGVAARNYRSEQDRYQDLQASYSALMANATGSAASGKTTGSPDYSRISNGCSEENESTTGSFYRPEFFGKPRFTMYCNKDASNTPFYSLFTADFNGCMSACASWNSYNASNSVCEAVSFIPLWSDVVTAVKGKAPGDCYLKPGPQSVQKLQTPNIGTECHAAILLHNATTGS
ncbi:hypothetical protein E4U40_002646 [Claviceps sp. LM458 group G5]|nr:hypothetical protein E4U40_002646 [Claviceps sp. LM458 group G5]